MKDDKENKISCKKCESEKRNLWTFKNYPKLNRIKNGYWLSLVQCPECLQYWIESFHEPYSSFAFLTKWDFDEKEFLRLLEIDNSSKLHEIHDKMIVDNWELLPPDEQEAIDTWRKRTYYQYNPIDIYLNNKNE